MANTFLENSAKSFDLLKITRKKVPKMAGIIIYFFISYCIFKKFLFIRSLI